MQEVQKERQGAGEEREGRMGRGGGRGGGLVGVGGSSAETHNQLVELLQKNVNVEITAWNLPLGDRLWLPAAEALKTNTACKRLTIYGCDIGIGARISSPNAWSAACTQHQTAQTCFTVTLLVAPQKEQWL